MIELKRAILGVAMAAMAASASAAAQTTNVMHVPLADGSTVRIEYHGDVPPNVTIEPARRSHGERAIERRKAQRERIRQIKRRNRDASRAATAVSVNDLPEGASSVSVVSVNTPAGMCTRTTRVTSQGAGKPPLVVSEAKGNCDGVELGEVPAPLN